MTEIEKVNNFEKVMSLVLGIGGLIINFIGILGTLLNSFLQELNFVTTIFRVSIVTVSFILNIILFIYHQKNGKWKKCLYFSALLNGYFLFPFMLLNLNLPFFPYYFLLSVYAGLTVSKVKYLLPFIPIIVIADIIIIFNPELPSYLCIGFSTTFIFNIILCAKFYSAYTFERKRLIKNEELLNTLASKDELTGLYNRRTFDQDILIQNYTCGIMFDIDNFKNINNVYGHLVGDEALKKFSQILLKHCSDEFTIYRYGGEEFFVLSRFTKEKTVKILENIFTDIRQNFKVDDLFHKVYNISITVSAGMSSKVVNTNSMILISSADANLYLAKNSGRDRAYIDSVPYFVEV